MGQALWEAPGVVLLVEWLSGRTGHGMEPVGWEGWAMEWRWLIRKDGQWARGDCGGRN